MKKLALILGMFLALTFMSMGINSAQKVEISTWTITQHCVHDINDVCLGAVDIEPFVMTIVAKYKEGDYGTITLDNPDQIKYSLTKILDQQIGSNYKTFYFEGLNEYSVECSFIVTFYYQDRNFHVYLSVKHPDKILNWTGELLELEDPGIEI